MINLIVCLMVLTQSASAASSEGKLSNRRRLENRARDARTDWQAREAVRALIRSRADDASREAENLDRLAETQKRELREARDRLRQAKASLGDAQGKAADAETRMETAAQVARSAAVESEGWFKSLVKGLLFGSDGSRELQELATAAEKGARAKRDLEDRQRALRALVDQIASSEAAISRLEKEAPKSRKQAEGAKDAARRLRSEASDAERAASQAQQEADRLEEAHSPIQKAYFKKVALANQHLLREGRKLESRRRYRQAARETETAYFSVAKPGKASQDAFSIAPESGRIAISDGVTRDTQFSGEFAQELVSAWTADAPPSLIAMGPWLKRVQAAWKLRADPLIGDRQHKSWNQDMKEWVGKATFVGVELKPIKGSENTMIRALGLGDSVIFHVRGDELVRAWPKTRLEDFDTFEANGSERQTESFRSDGPSNYLVTETSWEGRPGDWLLHVSDPLGEWIYRELKGGRSPFELLLSIETREDMQEFVMAARKGKIPGSEMMAVDDTTMVRTIVPTRQ